MNENKLSPVVIPTLLIHAGFLGLLTLLVTFLLDDRLASLFGFVGSGVFAFLIFVGLLTIRYYRLNPIYFEDTTFALKAMTVLLFQITAPLNLFIILVADYYLGPVFVMLIILFLLYPAHITCNYAVRNYCRLFKREEPAAARWWILFLVVIFNLIFCMILFRFLIIFAGASC